jgi:hypothetical protein
MKKIIKIITWDEKNYEKVVDMLKMSFEYHEYIDVMIGDNDEINGVDLKIYVGYSKTLTNKPEMMLESLDITDNQINTNCFWIFGYDEDRVLFGKYLKKYVKELTIKFFEDYIQYECVDYIFSDNVHSVDDFINFYIDIDKAFFTGLSYYFTLKSSGEYKIYNISLKMVKFYEGSNNVALLRHYIENNSLMLRNGDNNDYVEFKNKFNMVLDDVLCERYYVLF